MLIFCLIYLILIPKFANAKLTHQINAQCPDYFFEMIDQDEYKVGQIYFGEHKLLDYSIKSSEDFHLFIQKIEFYYNQYCQDQIDLRQEILCHNQSLNSDLSMSLKFDFNQLINELKPHEKICDPFINFKFETKPEGKFGQWVRRVVGVDRRRLKKSIEICKPNEIEQLHLNRVVTEVAPLICLDWPNQKVNFNQSLSILDYQSSPLMLKKSQANMDKQALWELEQGLRILKAELIEYLDDAVVRNDDITNYVAKLENKIKKKNKKNKFVVKNFMETVSENDHIAFFLSAITKELIDSDQVNSGCINKYEIASCQACECEIKKNTAREKIKKINYCLKERRKEIARQSFQIYVEDFMKEASLNAAGDLSFEVNQITNQLDTCFNKESISNCLEQVKLHFKQAYSNRYLDQKLERLENDFADFWNVVTLDDRNLSHREASLECAYLPSTVELETCLSRSQDQWLKRFTLNSLPLNTLKMPKSKEWITDFNQCEADLKDCLTTLVLKLATNQDKATQSLINHSILNKNTTLLPTFILQIFDEFIFLEPVVLDKKLKRNEQAYHCERDTKLINTIVFHHTASEDNVTVEAINDGHLNRSTSDPWLMVGYHYLIRNNENDNQTSIFRGREDHVVGAHAGVDAVTLDYPTQKLNEFKKIGLRCGRGNSIKSKVEFDIEESDLPSANATSVGIAFIGNFHPFHPVRNPSGYQGDTPRLPRLSSLIQAAKLACSLQKKYPSINQLTYHALYTPTACPGLIKEKIELIKQYTRNFGCKF